MGVDRRLEVLHGRVTLCRGTGHPDQGRLCVMSFAALLAGEPHSDIPARVSPLIRDYAVMLNDAMPLEELQRLKPFAPRILGTDDGRDSERVALLRSALELEILPRLRSDSEAASGDGPLKGWWRRLA
ncbi:hypothetical protein [Crenalkalicoccus roseus]|uniref:hypothetical protein n=1 Tax=Crenalkalicoccus roseus TaxID=1485588 RepID=UPI001080ACFA|nr:hypothetical protein [Crenalkalicoccus roseus]